MKKVLILFLLFLGTTTTSFSQALTSDQKAEIDEYLNKQIKEGAPGLAAGVILNGEVIYEKYAGLASLQHQVPVNEQTRFNIASVAKQFTALCVLKLVLDQQLSLDDDIRQYLPEFYPGIQDSIKIRHLLNHSSGIRDFYDLLSVQRDAWWRKEGFDNKDAIDYLKNQQDLNFRPGSDYMYSNSNYTLLTRIVAEVSGQTFHEFAKELFTELGMPNTQYLKNYMHVIPNQAIPYSDWGNGIWQQYPMMTNLYGDGFLFTTLKDQLAFEMAVQQANKPLLTISQQPIKNAEIQTYGFGLELEDRLGYPAVHHSGSTGSYHAQTVRYPSEKLSVVVMSNNGNIWSGFMADKIASVLLPEEGAAQSKDDGLTASDYSASLEESTLLGEYISPDGGLIRIIQSEGQLLWRQANNNPITLEKEAGSIYHFERNPKVRIGFLSGQFTVYYPGSEPRIHQKLAAFSPTKNYLNGLTGTYISEELDLTFEVDLDESGQLVLDNKKGRGPKPLEIIQKDQLLLNDYIIRPQRNAVDKVESFLLTYNRIKNVKFERRHSDGANQLKYTADGGYIQVGTTTASVGKGKGDILLTKNDANGNEEWWRTFGGTSYDKASSVELTSDGGYLIVGSTSSFGNGNYDVWIIKTDRYGNEEWNKTFGKTGNEYGFQAIEDEDGNFKILATKGGIEVWLNETYVFTI